MGITSQIMLMRVTLYSITDAIRGCIYEEGEEGMDENLTQSSSQIQLSTVSPAAKQQFLHSNSSNTFQFRNYNGTISYLSTSPHLVKVAIGGDPEAIGIKRSTKRPENHCGYCAMKDDIDYSIKPVVWEHNIADEGIWSFGIWNSSELNSEVHIIK